MGDPVAFEAGKRLLDLDLAALLDCKSLADKLASGRPRCNDYSLRESLWDLALSRMRRAFGLDLTCSLHQWLFIHRVLILCPLIWRWQKCSPIR